MTERECQSLFEKYLKKESAAYGQTVLVSSPSIHTAQPSSANFLYFLAIISGSFSYGSNTPIYNTPESAFSFHANR